MDVNNAFLHGDLTEEIYMNPLEEIYMNPLEGYSILAGKTLRLTKSLCGLKQANCQWYAKLSKALLQWGFILASSDHSLFVQNSDSSFLALLVYVDNIVLVSNKMDQVVAVKKHLHELFRIKYLRELKYFLGFEVACFKSPIHLSQKKFGLDLLKDSSFLESKPVNTLMMHDCCLVKEGTPLPDKKLYRRLVGKLLYLTITRPDIAYSIQQLSQFLYCPTIDHLVAAHRVLRYIKGSIGQGLFYS